MPQKGVSDLQCHKIFDGNFGGTLALCAHVALLLD